MSISSARFSLRTHFFPILANGECVVCIVAITVAVLGSVWYSLLNRVYNSRAYTNRVYTNRAFGQKIIGCLVVNKKSTFKPLNCVIFFILSIFKKVL